VTPAALPLSGWELDRAAHHRDDAPWLAEAWVRGRVLPVTAEATAAVSRSANPALAYRDPDDIPAEAPRRFLGLVRQVPYFAATVAPDAGDWATLREVGGILPAAQAEQLATALALEQWHQRHPRCPRCGAGTIEAQAGWIRRCPTDGSEHFPRTDPAIITIVHDGAGRTLLGRSARWPEGRFSTLAGFVEPGESLEAAVRREILEEVSVEVADIRYLASQPWPFPSSLMLGFAARVYGEQTVRPDQVEMADAGWFTREEVRRAARWADGDGTPDPRARLRGVSPGLSISRWLIERWLADELPG
jgi:NAD+ diphosphatase